MQKKCAALKKNVSEKNNETKVCKAPKKDHREVASLAQNLGYVHHLLKNLFFIFTTLLEIF